MYLYVYKYLCYLKYLIGEHTPGGQLGQCLSNAYALLLIFNVIYTVFRFKKDMELSIFVVINCQLIVCEFENFFHNLLILTHFSYALYNWQPTPSSSGMHKISIIISIDISQHSICSSTQ